MEEKLTRAVKRNKRSGKMAETFREEKTKKAARQAASASQQKQEKEMTKRRLLWATLIVLSIAMGLMGGVIGVLVVRWY